MRNTIPDGLSIIILEGDHYFKIHREDHNLDRCRTQFKLVADMEKKWDLMQKIVAKYQ